MAFPCRTAKNMIGCLAAAWFLCAAQAPLSAANLTPSISDVGISSLAFSWGGATGNCTMNLSTMSNFSVLTATGSLTALTTTYVNLTQNEIYYFRVKRSTDSDATYVTISTVVTYAAAPSGVSFVPANFASDSSSTARIGLDWAMNGNPEWTDYLVEYSKDSLLAGSSTFMEPLPPAVLGSLEANTTYYLRVRAVNLADVQSAPTPIVSTITLAQVLSGITETIYQSSTTVSWTPVDGAAQAEKSEGYRLTLSRSENLAVLITDLSIPDNTVSSTTLTGLDPNTTYYYRAGTLNWNGVMAYEGTRNFTTLAVQPQGLRLISATTNTATLDWTALPAGPSSATAMGYRLEASSSDFSGGTILTTATYNISDSTLTLQNLDANTTYYFRIGALNQAAVPTYSARLSTITLSVPLLQGQPSAAAAQQSVTVTLTPPLPSSPKKNSCEGYLLQASSRTFGAGSVIYSSVSYTNLTNSMTLESLRPNTTYYLRMATLNWTGTPNFIDLPLIRTSMAGPLESVSITAIWESSAAISFTSLVSDGYVLEASTNSYFSPVLSSSTLDSGAGGLTVTGLDRNTLYYFHAGPLYNGTTVYTNLTPSSPRSTLAKPLGSPLIAGVFHSSVTVSWTALAAAPQNMTAEQYHLEASTSPDFANVVYTAITSDITLTSMTVLNLIPNTSYYLRAGTLNWDDAENYVYTPATSTLANAPIQTDFTSLTTGQMRVNWLPNSNPSDTLYRVRFSSNSDLVSPPVFSSDTRNTFASFGGLEPNTTYYPEVTAINRLNRPEGPYTFNAMATLAYVPDFSSFSSLGVSSITLNWLRGSNPAGNTWYEARISSSPAFAELLLSSVTLATSATFYGLVSDATYYLQVFALNRTGVRTDTARDLGAALTLPSTAYTLSPDDTFSGRLTDGFTLHWTSNGNSTHTVYNLTASTASDFNSGASSKTASVRGLFYNFTDLMVDTTYWTRIQSVGQAGALTAFAEAGSTRTLLSNEAGALVSKDTLVTLQTSYGLISVFMPFGSLGGSSRITVSTIRPEDVFAQPVSAVSVLRPTGIGIIINQFPPVRVLNPITITLPYRVSDLSPGVDRSRLVLALYDEGSRVWVPLPSVSDLPNHKVTAQTWHLSTFQLMETLPAAELGSTRIYPNPYAPSSVSDVMHFSNMPPYAKVKIYTFLGELVKALTADANGMAYWDGKNTGGQKVASGVYIALLQTQDKKSHKVVKVVVER